MSFCRIVIYRDPSGTLFNRVRIAKTMCFVDSRERSPNAETLGNPWKPLGNPYGNPSETPPASLRKQREGRTRNFFLLFWRRSRGAIIP